MDFLKNGTIHNIVQAVPLRSSFDKVKYTLIMIDMATEAPLALLNDISANLTKSDSNANTDKIEDFIELQNALAALNSSKLAVQSLEPNNVYAKHDKDVKENLDDIKKRFKEIFKDFNRPSATLVKKAIDLHSASEELAEEQKTDTYQAPSSSENDNASKKSGGYFSGAAHFLAAKPLSPLQKLTDQQREATRMGYATCDSE